MKMIRLKSVTFIGPVRLPGGTELKTYAMADSRSEKSIRLFFDPELRVVVAQRGDAEFHYPTSMVREWEPVLPEKAVRT